MTFYLSLLDQKVMEQKVWIILHNYIYLALIHAELFDQCHIDILTTRPQSEQKHPSHTKPAAAFDTSFCFYPVLFQPYMHVCSNCKNRASPVHFGAI